MKLLLGEEEYNQYIQSYQDIPKKGLRVNTLKISTEEFEKISPFDLEKIPWTSNGYYFNTSQQPAKHPYYFAGLYYIQEPCAMTPAELLPVVPGDKVLDLCAAPGGKSTELAAKLKGEGVMVSNDISSSRAKALLKNIELFGVKNGFVTSETPEKLLTKFEHYFDKILIDAPCSGEGMFRKEPSIIKNWEKQGVAFFANLQRQIVSSAVKMLKPGGKLLYSTCTFSPEENEGTIQYILEQFPEFTVDEIPNKYDGFSSGHPEWIENGQEQLKNCIRLWPHKVKGEGHFVALLTKKEDSDTKGVMESRSIEEVFEKERSKKKGKKKSKTEKIQEGPSLIAKEAEDFLKGFTLTLQPELFEQHSDRLYQIPEGMIDTKGLHVLCGGLLIGENKKKRFEPSQALAMALKKEQAPKVINLSLNQEQVIKYLKGETIMVDDDTKGWVLICVDGFPLGWGKANQGMLKNKYYSGWRLL